MTTRRIDRISFEMGYRRAKTEMARELIEVANRIDYELADLRAEICGVDLVRARAITVALDVLDAAEPPPMLH
jgi:hypothetical protein